MKIIMLLLLVISISFTQSYRSNPFPKPVVDPEPPGFNPVEPVFPMDRPCKKIYDQDESCTQEILDLKEKIEQLEVQLRQLRSIKQITCLGEIEQLNSVVGGFEKSKNIELNLDGTESGFESLINDDVISELPRFYRNIRYSKGRKISCELSIKK